MTTALAALFFTSGMVTGGLILLLSIRWRVKVMYRNFWVIGKKDGQVYNPKDKT